MADYDLVIRGGEIFDGSGGPGFTADIAVVGGKIAAVGEVTGRGHEEIDARGKIVTPGFVDIHTHYDGQVTWEDTTSPSSEHGVTTVVMGNCGVGFAPCKPEDRERLIRLMEGVEDIPEVVMTEGLLWDWETFPDYLDRIERRSGDVDVAAQLPHSCLRVYVMGQRGVDREPATADDLARMTAIAEEAIRAGAVGFGTSRTIFHQFRDGGPIPSKDVGEEELHAIAAGLKRAGSGVIQAIVDFDVIEDNIKLLRRVAERSERPISFTLAETLDHPVSWRKAIELMDEANREGVTMRAQVLGRPTGMLLGLNLSFNPFSLHPSYKEIDHLPPAEKVRLLKQPEMKARILADSPSDPHWAGLKFLQRYDAMFPLGDPPDYEPGPEKSVAALARGRGISPEEMAYDLMLERDGEEVLFVTVANYVHGTLDTSLEMMRNENTMVALGDGGAHYGMICDAGNPTFMLSYWARDRKREKLPLPRVVRSLTRDPAHAVGLLDRGLIAPDYKADINVIDFDRLTLHAPKIYRDLPAGGKRLKQAADGYAATILSGVIVARDGTPTGMRPGTLVRGAQPDSRKA